MQNKIWFYVSLFPSLAALIGLSMAYLSYVQQWGGGDKIATVIAVFFCEIVMVISAFGAITYMKQEKTVISQRMLYWNIALALLGASSGIYLFLSQ